MFSWVLKRTREEENKVPRTLTKKHATKRLSVTPERHRKLDHLSIDRNKTLIEIADEVIEAGIEIIESRRAEAVPSAN